MKSTNDLMKHRRRDNRMIYKFRFCSSDCEVDLSNLIMNSNLFLKQNPFSSIKKQLDKSLHQLSYEYRISAKSLIAFFNLQSDFSYEFSDNLCSDLCILAHHFQDQELLEFMYQYFDQKLSSQHVILNELRNYEYAFDNQHYNNIYMDKVDHLAINHLNEFINDDQYNVFEKLSPQTHYRLFQKWSKLDNKPEIDCQLLLTFIQRSVYNRHPLLSFIDVSNLSTDSQIEFIHRIFQDSDLYKYREYFNFPFPLFRHLFEEIDQQKHQIKQLQNKIDQMTLSKPIQQEKKYQKQNCSQTKCIKAKS